MLKKAIIEFTLFFKSYYLNNIINNKMYGN